MTTCVFGPDSQIGDKQVNELRRLLGQIDGKSWSYNSISNEVRIEHGSKVVSMRVMHDSAPSPTADVQFVALCRADTVLLLETYESRGRIAPAVAEEIRSRYQASSPGPWIPWLESDGGLGGCNVITMGDDTDADLYLWIEDELAPDPNWRFVAAAHTTIPALLRLLEDYAE